MTENKWPEDGSYGTPTATQQTPLRPETTFPPTVNGGTSTTATSADGGASKTDAARGEAADLKRQATDSAQTVAETAKTEAANVAAEVKTNARDLLHQAKSDLTDQAGTQQQKAAEGIRSISSELTTMADASEQPGVATDLIRQAAERSQSVATWLENRDPGSLLTEVKSFARQRPGTFLLLAAGAGVLAGRLSRGLSAGAPETGTAGANTARATRVPDTGMAVPPPPVQMPAPETTRAGVADTYPPNPLDADPLGDSDRQDRWASEPVVTDPTRQDPFRDDPFDGGRR
ncbi:hypothetical protein [Arthrobacter sp. UYEF36]|uniref:hypothetical protein n=1 Tax=Arthrobacter sp. UYEF36 TaxID=1756366 RepID=UPI003392D550